MIKKKRKKKEAFYNNSHYHLDNYKAIHSERKTKKKGGGVLIYIKTNLMYRIRDDLSVSGGDREYMTIEIINKGTKIYIISCCYKPPNGNTKNFTAHLNKIFQSANSEQKGFFILGDFILNCLNYNENTEVRDMFTDQWARYKDMTKLRNLAEIRNELRSTCSREVNKLLFDLVGAESLNT